MKRTALLGLIMTACSAWAQPHTTTISDFCLSGPYAVSQPFALDSVDASGKKYDKQSVFSGLSLHTSSSTLFQGSVLPSLADSPSVGILSFYINNTSYLKAALNIEGLKEYKLYIDGQETQPQLNMSPDHHTVAIKYMAEAGATDSLRVSITPTNDVPFTVTTDKRHPYMVHDLTDGQRVRAISLSADGQYVTMAYQTTERGGQSRWEYELRNVKTTQLISRLNQSVVWMPRSCAYIEEVWEANKRVLYRTNPTTGERAQLAYDVPRGSYTISPTEDYLVINAETEGTKDDPQVHEILEMDDRQPGWRNRNHLMRYDLKSGLCQRITFGNKGERLQDISSDGQQLLVSSTHSRLEKRPTSVMDLFLIDAYTLKADTLMLNAEHIDVAHFSPDGKQLVFRGNPEAFNRIGCVLADSVIPSQMENELFLYDLTTRKTTPLTRDFDPSINNIVWSRFDGHIYFSAEDHDYVRLYQLNPTTGKIVQLEAAGDNVFRFSMAANSSLISYLSYETLAPASAFIAYTAKGKSAMKQVRLFDGKSVIKDAQLCTCQDWNFQSSRGYTVYGRLYLPADFDHSKQYPLIVYYYGGCSPTSRYFESPYAPQYWTSLGYIAYIIQPSGATGFGQEWASRHVNTAGRGPADDIIEGVTTLCNEHPFINRKKIGCMGASYGGFMTQYLQTVTDIFAAAVSHAGISNHTSYWGEGYWGYNYSEVSMANSYPWSHRQLYVDQSPLFNADKIHTPLLLLHGSADTNVPLIESLQMFTALKLLGREVSLVQVEGENHHILDYAKREKWLATQMAWFQRWLKDDPTWWDALYPKKHL